jgi:1-acyl-sn-glycerol-3-phosphate acyltransferase
MAYPFLRRTLLPWLRTFFKDISGLENIPRTGPYIIAANHVGLIDYFFIVTVFCRYTPEKIHFISKRLWLRDLLLQRAWGQIPIDPWNKEACLQQAWDCLKHGEVVCIFPEGSASGNNSELLPAKTGVAKLALWSHLPVLPVGFIGPARVGKYFLSIKNLRSLWSFRKNVTLSIGKPLTFTEYDQQHLSGENIKSILRCIMESIADLSGKKYIY